LVCGLVCVGGGGGGGGVRAYKGEVLFNDAVFCSVYVVLVADE